MRLLERTADGIRLTEDFLPGRIPIYAILSHTWGPEAEEVTYQDMRDRTGENKPGYEKLRFCAEATERDGLRYFWVDTCCIDKSSSAVVSESITSMFRWYKNAHRCYVYLSDVEVTGSSSSSEQPSSAPAFIKGIRKSRRLQSVRRRRVHPSDVDVAGSSSPSGPSSTPAWDESFRKSRWFTRGWTLQELLAPKHVEFFSKDRQSLGDKTSLEQTIHEITGIPLRALRGEDLAQFHVEDRFRWAENRKTTRAEDRAYCLLGVFGVSMVPNYGEEDEAFRRLRQKVENATTRPQKERAWLVPFEQNAGFTGREQELEQLDEAHSAIMQTTKVAVTGLGGMGKTQLVLEFVFRASKKSPDCSVFWVSCVSKETIERDYRKAAQDLGLPGWQDGEADLCKMLHDYLGSNDSRRWILVLDNADDMTVLRETMTASGSRRLPQSLPQNKLGTIVVTTRDKKEAVDLLPGRKVISLSEMDEERCEKLLRNYLQDDNLLQNKEDTTTLLRQLAYLPLALVQAAAYINKNTITIGSYLQLMSKQESDVIELLSEEFENEYRYEGVQNPVATTWLISFAQIQQRDPRAAEYLSFMACVDHKDIPQTLLLPGLPRKADMDALGTLKAYSFLTEQTTHGIFNMHRLVHMAMRNWLRKKDTLSSWMETAMSTLELAMNEPDLVQREKWRSLLPHASYALSSQNGCCHNFGFLTAYAGCIYVDGHYREAEGLYRQAREIALKELGEEHPKTLMSQHRLARVYERQGQLAEAEALYVQTMEMRKQVLGEEHPETLDSLHDLAVVYNRQGRLTEAEALYDRVVKTRKRVLGEDHPNSLTGLHNLAIVYDQQGRLTEAEALYDRVVKTCKRVLGEEHPETLSSLHNLALLYTKQGRLEEAEVLYDQVVEAYKKVLGKEHPDSLTGLQNLAEVYGQQGRLAEAEALFRQVIDAQKRVLGEEHPSTLHTEANLAQMWKRQGRLKDALKLMESCAQASLRALGSEHPFTLGCLEEVDMWRREIE